MSLFKEGKKEIDLLVKKYGCAHELGEPYWKEERETGRNNIFVSTPDEDEVVLGGLEYDEIDHYFELILSYYLELIDKEMEGE